MKLKMHKLLLILAVCIVAANCEHTTTLRRIKRGSTDPPTGANNSKILQDFAPLRGADNDTTTTKLANLTNAKLITKSTKEKDNPGVPIVRVATANDTNAKAAKATVADDNKRNHQNNDKATLNRLIRESQENRDVKMFDDGDTENDFELPRINDEDAFLFGGGIAGMPSFLPELSPFNIYRKPRRNYQAKIYSISTNKKNKYSGGANGNSGSDDDKEGEGNLKYTIKIISKGDGSDKDGSKHGDNRNDDDIRFDDNLMGNDDKPWARSPQYKTFHSNGNRYAPPLRRGGDIRAIKRDQGAEKVQQKAQQGQQPKPQQIAPTQSNEQVQQAQKGQQAQHAQKNQQQAQPNQQQTQPNQQRGQQPQPAAHAPTKLNPLEGLLKFANMLLYSVGGLDNGIQHPNPAAMVLNNPVEDDNDAIDYFYNAMDSAPAIRSAPNAGSNALAPASQGGYARTPFVFQPPLTNSDGAKPLNFIENAIDMLLANDDDADDDFELRCPVHYEKKSVGLEGGANEGGAGGPKNDMIQVCSCRLYKKKKNSNV